MLGHCWHRIIPLYYTELLSRGMCELYFSLLCGGRSSCYLAKGALVVYDVTSRESRCRPSYLNPTTYFSPGFEHARSWLADVRQYADPNLSCILVGNKVDLCDFAEAEPSLTSTARRKRREVPRETAELWAKEEGMLFIETSAKSGDNVDEAFRQAATDVVSKIKRGIFDEGKVRVHFNLRGERH